MVTRANNREIYDSLKMLLKACWGNYRRKILVAIVAMTFCSLLEGIGFLSLIPLLQFADLGIFSSQNSNWLSTFSAFFQVKFSLASLLIFYIVLVSSMSTIAFFNAKLIQRLQVEFISGYRCKLYHAYLYSSYKNIVTVGRAAVNNLLTNEVGRVGVAIAQLTRCFASFITVLISIITACFISLPLTLIAFACGGFLYGVLMYQIKHAHKLGVNGSFLYNKLFKDINDQLNCIKMVKVYGNEKIFFDRFHATDAGLQQQAIQFRLINAGNTLWYSIGGVVCFSIIFYVANVFFHTPLPILFVLLAIFSRIVPQISSMQHDINLLINVLPSVAIIENNLEKFKSVQLKNKCDNNVEFISLHSAIELKNIFFRYATTDKYLFENLNLSIAANKITAIVGPSGIGKSTLVDILMGLLVPESGIVLVDGQRISFDQFSGWQKILGYVPRDSTILQDTIRSNLLLANPHASEQQIIEALKITRADDFIDRLPQKLDTALDDFGHNLSAGQKQRLMLACALLRQPKLLILDEATNSIDAGNEVLIYEALKQMREKVTIVLITHNRHNLSFVDNIIDLEKFAVNTAREMNIVSQELSV